MEKMKKEREARKASAKSGANTVERARAWANANDKDKAEIARLSEKAREKYES